MYEAEPIALFPRRLAEPTVPPDTTCTRGNLSPWLPASPDVGFIGRDGLVMTLDRAFDTHWVVLLHGPPGSGKTAAAAEFARWYAGTGGVDGPVLYTPFTAATHFEGLLDDFEEARRLGPAGQGSRRDYQPLVAPASGPLGAGTGAGPVDLGRHRPDLRRWPWGGPDRAAPPGGAGAVPAPVPGNRARFLLLAAGPEEERLESGKRDKSGKRDRAESGTGPILLNCERESGTGKRDGSDIVKLSGPADVRVIFTRARHFDFGPPFAGDPWDDRPTLGPNVARFPSAIPAGQRGGLVAHSDEALPVPARRRFD